MEPLTRFASHPVAAPRFRGQRRVAVTVAVLTGLAGICAACSGEAADDAADDAVDGSSVEGAWARATPGAAPTGAVYLTIESGDDDRLLGVSVPPSVAASASIHRSVADGGMVSMEHVEELALPAGETVELAPGGTHVMLVDLAAPLRTGTRFDVVLDFESQPDQVVSVEVLNTAPGE